MKKNKGFTLVELLAVITILAIIMVIAVPKIVDSYKSSVDSGWEQTIVNAKKAVETESNIYDPSTGQYKYTVSSLCTSKLAGIIDTTDIKVACALKSGKYVFKLTGKNRYQDRTYIFRCDENGDCSY